MNVAFQLLTDEQWFDHVVSQFQVPPEDIQSGTVGRAGVPVLRDGFLFWQFARHMLQQHGNGLSGETKVMDFGCAWGRILRYWLRDLPAQNLYGSDVQERLMAFARRDVPDCNYAINNPSPPSQMASDSFDLIYAFSVFSHLPADVADPWIDEFARILKPGGIACLTTRPRIHIERAGTDAIKGDRAGALTKIITDREHNLKRYDAGEFIYYPGGGKAGLASETYGEAIIPEAYARQNWQSLELVGFFENYTQTYMQPCFVLRKS
ncbi:class I SAM-dependent methyltransferase [Hyphomonas chukchiensis]|uniref:class I SAM-dependent methyltransferase n=1 Tax=Hyphomonas chukchiensis TaxID=1280947 RepID=UPI0030F8957E